MPVAMIVTTTQAEAIECDSEDVTVPHCQCTDKLRTELQSSNDGPGSPPPSQQWFYALALPGPVPLAGLRLAAKLEVPSHVALLLCVCVFFPAA